MLAFLDIVDKRILLFDTNMKRVPMNKKQCKDDERACVYVSVYVCVFMCKCVC